jgi:gluconate:H+ symporter, GntP family
VALLGEAAIAIWDYPASGSLVGSWMNYSGFWIYTKMGGLTELEALKSWTALLALLGITSMLVTVILSLLLPLT